MRSNKIKVVEFQVCGKRIMRPESKWAINNGTSYRDSKRMRLTTISRLGFKVVSSRKLVKEMATCTRLSLCKILRSHLDIRNKLHSNSKIKILNRRVHS